MPKSSHSIFPLAESKWLVYIPKMFELVFVYGSSSYTMVGVKPLWVYVTEYGKSQQWEVSEYATIKWKSNK